MLKNLRRTLSDLDSDDVLEKLGLQSRQSSVERIMPALAVFGAGVLVGVGIGMFLAPRSGSELRGQLQSQFDRARRKIGIKGEDELGADGEANSSGSAAPIRPA